MSETRKKVATAIITVLTVGLVGLASVAAGAADVRPGGQRIELTGTTTGSNGDPDSGHSFGDLLVFTDVLFDLDGEQVGEAVASAVVTSGTLTFGSDDEGPAGEMLCTITLSFEDGQISLVGAGDIATILSGEAYTMPIVGGSGAYGKVRGEAIYQVTGATDDGAMLFDVTLILR